MAIPVTLIQTESRPVWDASSGQQTVVTYEGTATETELAESISIWQAAGAIRIDPVKRPYQYDGAGEYSYEVTVTVTYPGVVVEGEIPNPASPDYGLFSRVWTLDYEDDQVPLIAGVRATELFDYDRDWPTRISTAATRFRSLWSAYLAAEATASGSGTKPNRVSDWHPVVQIPGSGTAPSGVGRNAIAVWLFDRLCADEEATDRIERPILRKVETVANVSNVIADNRDAGRVFRYSTLLNRETTLDAATLLNLARLHTEFPYWKKGRPVMSTAQYGRFDIQQTYTGIADYDGIQWRAAL